jgi:2,4-dichlorophenol 6-monooxygenase
MSQPSNETVTIRDSWSAASDQVEGQAVQHDVIVVGSGPTGVGTALMLARHGLKVTVVTRETWVADSPRAHITNQRTMEVLRALGLEDPVTAQASPRETMASQVVATAFNGTELGRVWSWGNNPGRQGEYLTASPTVGCDIPQNRLEPILLAEAARLGVLIRFQNTFTDIEQDDDGVTVHVVDGLTGRTGALRASYVVAADGGQSPIAQALDIPFLGEAGMARAVNISFRADLSRYVAHRPGSLYEIIQNRPEGPTRAMIRMVKPWQEWSASLVYLGERNTRLTHEEAEHEIRQAIGDDSIDVTITGLYGWKINRVVAEHYGKGRVFLAGDAAHRHPPTNGLGANTCLQDGFNLAWKIAYVLKGMAGPGLLETYSAERQPVGQQVVNRAIDSWKLGADLLPSLGLDPSLSYEERAAQFAQLGESTDAGEQRRRAVAEVLEEESYIFEAHGVEMNQVYSSAAVVDDGTELVYERDEQLYIQPSSHPGARIPHAWIGDATGTVSTLDVVGTERFTLITRDRGQAWANAAQAVAAELGLELGKDLATVVIGHAGDVQDLYGEFARRSEIGETGCLLVRPDQHIALRQSGAAEDPAAVLREALTQVLDLRGAAAANAATPDGVLASA